VRQNRYDGLLWLRVKVRQFTRQRLASFEQAGPFLSILALNLYHGDGWCGSRCRCRAATWHGAKERCEGSV